MNFKIFKPISFTWVAMLLLAASMLFVDCKKDPVDPTDNVIASFQYAVSTSNFLEVTFTNFSQNATSYSWDFGDGQSSTEKDPTHVYDAVGTYTIKLTASNAAGDDASRSETIILDDPDALLTRLAGTSSKTWYLQREGVALGIGPGPAYGDNSWWAFGANTPLGDRPCILDDAYTFHRDGTWEIETNNTVFVDSDGNGGWLSQDEGCHDEDEAGLWSNLNPNYAIGADLSAYANGGDYTYEFDATANTITLLGSGAYIGLPAKTENGDNVIPVSLKTYEVFKFVEGDIADSLQMSIVGSGFIWNFYLVSYHNPADLPEIPSTVPAAGFSYAKNGLEVTFTNTSTNSTSYMWDFGDGNTSTDKDPVHTYAAAEAYTVTLTAMDDLGKSDEFSVIIDLSGGPSEPAPTPTYDPANVISIFSDAYTNVAGTDFNPNWGQATGVTEDLIDGNNTLHYTALNYQGIALGSNQDVSGMTYLHLDFWTTSSTALNVFLISPGNEIGYALTVPTTGWTSIDIPLSEFVPPVDLTDVFQFKFDGNGEIYLDNILFRN